MKSKQINNSKTIVVKKERLFHISISFKTIIYIIGVIVSIFCIWYILKNKHLEIYLHSESNEKVSLLFSILVSMSLLMFMLSCGFQVSYSNIIIKITLIILIFVIIYYGYFNYGLGFIFNTNFGFLVHIIYESNSREGIMFFIRNWLFWSFVYIVSLMFMSEI
jgi:hypothetical protein